MFTVRKENAVILQKWQDGSEPLNATTATPTSGADEERNSTENTALSTAPPSIVVRKRVAPPRTAAVSAGVEVDRVSAGAGVEQNGPAGVGVHENGTAGVGADENVSAGVGGDESNGDSAMRSSDEVTILGSAQRKTSNRIRRLVNTKNSHGKTLFEGLPFNVYGNIVRKKRFLENPFFQLIKVGKSVPKLPYRNQKT